MLRLETTLFLQKLRQKNTEIYIHYTNTNCSFKIFIYFIERKKQVSNTNRPCVTLYCWNISTLKKLNLPGLPLSPLIFIPILQPLLRCLQQNPNIPGISGDQSIRLLPTQMTCYSLSPITLSLSLIFSELSHYISI